VVVGGHLLHGAGNRAGEIGHWVCPVPAELAGGLSGCDNGSWCRQVGARLEQVASLSAIVAAAQRGRERREATSLAAVEDELTIDDVLAAAREGDGFASSLVSAVGRVHGWVAHQLDQLFDPERIIFAGPLADLGELFLVTVRETARQLGNASHAPAITSSNLGQYNGAVGAAALALHQWKPRR
jgi:predicted NBD/HSP70 family sugar kinase